MGKGACYRLWTDGHFSMWTSEGEVKDWSQRLKKSEEKAKTGDRSEWNKLLKEWLGEGKGGHFRVNGVSKFMKNVGECIQEEQSKVSIPTVAGAATGAATLGIAGGGLGIYFLPKLIKCFI